MKPYTYLLIDLGCVIVPLLFSFYPKHPFYKEFRSFAFSSVIVGLCFIIWDVFFTRIGVWGFNPDYLTGIYIVNLPIEEIMFFFCIPYACTFTYFAFLYLLRPHILISYHRMITVSLIVILGLLCIFFYDRWYTMTTCLLTILLLIYILKSGVFMGKYYITYLCIIPFFLVSNGLLTGSWIDEPIVWYNDLENMAQRIGTIPIEDSIYGFLLVMSNLLLFDFFRGTDNLTTVKNTI